MVLFYVTKIKNQEINLKTNQSWTIEDVPKLWKLQVEQELSK